MLRKLMLRLLRRQQPAGSAHLELGRRGERMALDYLKRVEGYSIVATNLHVPLGRGIRGARISGEIDIVAYDGDTLAFIEVKTRTSDEVAAPERRISLKKQRQIARAARRYRQRMQVKDDKYRYDALTVVLAGQVRKIELIRGYFDDRVFLRSRYFVQE